MPRTTLADIARQAGVSKITVSRTFSSPEKVHAETRDQILRIARELNYVSPSQTTQRETAVTRTLGVVNPNMNNPFFGRMTREITLAARARGYTVLVFDSYESETLEAEAIGKLIEFSVDAVILSVISSDIDYHPAYLDRLEAAGIPVVLVDRELKAAHYGGVYIDNLDCGYQAGRYCLEQGLEKLLAVSGPADSMVSIGRMSGLREAIGSRRISLDVVYSDFSFEPAYQALREYLQEHPWPEGIIGANNQITMAVLKLCHEQGIVPQQDVQLFSIDDIEHSDVFGLHIPCIHHNLPEIAQQALQLALAAIQSPEQRGFRTVVRGQLRTW
ncbi:LacI family DNA-binding transcriptional regulator [Salinicola sp. MIT1003]|uniref:LacI family DNA-binding transcriptional regulator n=1 Tax=Salinicola sp. MIT1003 TaxID=1882734 RepID=UPI000AF3EC0D|nr:LacI family DNA-binding transcriptional regulator [Salinicola sp. MIT1003]MED5499297.1 LacI family DNA-binding transcriptional regulator [Pseudomonadota bacterium]